MAKTKKSAKSALTKPSTRPRTSPYTSRPIALRLGSGYLSYYVPKDLLQSLKDSFGFGFGADSIQLTDVDEDTGHVIAHYLYTGTYQTLADDDGVSYTFNARSELKKSILAFLAAKKYGLVALQELAKTEILRWGEEMDPLEIVQAISEDHLVRLKEDAVWLQDLVLQRVEAALIDDTIFSSGDFLNNIESSALVKLLAQRVIKFYRDSVLELRKKASDPHGWPHEKTKANVDEKIDAVPLAPSERYDAQPPFPIAEITVMSGMQGLSKKQEEKVATTEESPLSTLQPLAESERGVELGADVMSVPETLESILGVPEAIPETVEPRSIWASSIWGSSKMIKGIKRHTLLEPTTAGEIEPLEATPKTEAEQETVHAASSVSPEPESADKLPVVELEPQPSVEEEAPTTKSSHTKEAGETWSDWGMPASSIKKKKKKKKGLVQEEVPAPVIDMPVDPDPSESGCKPTLFDPSALNAAEVLNETINDDSCAARLTHLSGDGWKTCEPCELYMRRVALQLQTA